MPMKKIVFTLLFGLITAINIQAQYSIGAKAGMNMSTIHTSEGLADIIKYRPGLNLGGYLTYRLNDYFDLQTELLYSQQGYNWEVGYTNEYGYVIDNIKAKAIYHYLTLPILIKYYVFPRLNFEFGPQLGFRLANHYSLEDKNLNVWPTTNVFDFALTMGIGYDLTDRICFNARYCLGLTSSQKKMDQTQNRLFQFSIGYKLWEN